MKYIYLISKRELTTTNKETEMLVKATTANGIEAVKASDYTSDFIKEYALKFEYFYEELPHIKEGEEIFGDLTPSQFERLSKEYGIR
jgi:hypothetical protein